MKHIFHRLTALCLTLLFLLSTAPSARAVGTPAPSTTRNGLYNYSWWDAPVRAYLCENPQGGLTRVEYSEGNIIIEDYDANFNYLTSHTVSPELNLWGGFFAGREYNFFIFGQPNYTESDSSEVIRVVKYDKNWKRLGHASISGANTRIPFDAGSLRCAEAGGYLYIHTCHEMYKSDDGKNHQANLRMVIRQQDMTATEVSCDEYWGYVSHSFNQFILAAEDGSIVTADHGDAYPRAMILYRFEGQAGREALKTTDPSQFSHISTDKFPGETGDNYTGAQLGGLVETASGYVMAYSYNGGSSQAVSEIYLAYAARADISSDNIRYENKFQIYKLSDNSRLGARCPILVSTGLDGGWLLWKADSTFYYARYRADGTVDTVKSTSRAVSLSDCQPIVYQGKAVWYSTASSAPTFYVLDDNGVRAVPANSNDTASNIFSDVPATHWAAEPIRRAVQQGVVKGYSDGTFKPNEQMTYAQFCTLLAYSFYEQSYSTGDSAWYAPMVQTLRRQAVLDGTRISSDNADANQPINRYDMARMMYNLLKCHAALSGDGTQPNLRDWATVPQDYRTAVSTCCTLELLKGTDGAFQGEQAITRAQACTVLVRLQNYLAEHGTPIQIPSTVTPVLVSKGGSELRPTVETVEVHRGELAPDSSIDSNGNIFCAKCGHLMQTAEHPELFSSGDDSHTYYVCMTCHKYFLCGKCDTKENIQAHKDRCTGNTDD